MRVPRGLSPEASSGIVRCLFLGINELLFGRYLWRGSYLVETFGKCKAARFKTAGLTCRSIHSAPDCEGVQDPESLNMYSASTLVSSTLSRQEGRERKAETRVEFRDLWIKRL